jgi:hypothetical protein
VSNAISSSINSQLITRLSQVAGVKVARASGSSDVKFSSADQVSSTLNAGGRTFAKAFTNLSTAANFVNIGIDTLKQLDQIVTKVINLGEKAARFGSGRAERANISAEFRRLSGQFTRILEATDKAGDFNPLSEKDIENVLVNVGIDREKSLELASIFKKLRLVAGSSSLADDNVRDLRPIQPLLDTSDSGGEGSSGAVQRVSTSSTGALANGASSGPSLSSDGRYLVFQSDASNLVAGDTNAISDVFIKDLQTGTTTRVSTDSSGTEGNDSSTWASVTSDGRYVAFTSAASNLVSPDTNGVADIFVKDTVTGTTTRVSTDSSGTEANDASVASYMTPDGRYVFFSSTASNLVAGDTNGAQDVFRKDLVTGTTIRVSEGTGGVEGDGGSSLGLSGIRASNDGRYVVFDSVATNLVVGDTNGTGDTFVKDLTTGTLTLVNASSAGVFGNGSSSSGSLTPDGTKVVFSSNATNLVAGDTNGNDDVFVKDLSTGTVTLVSSSSSGTIGDSRSRDPFIASDGQTVAFSSIATNLVAGDTNGRYDVFLKNVQTGAISRISSDASGAQISSHSYVEGMSADGQHVAFYTVSPIDGADSNSVNDIAMVDTQFSEGETTSQSGNVRRFNRVFDTGRTILSRNDARVLIADAKVLQKNIRQNISTLEGVAQNVIDNIELVRTTALAMLDGARDPILLSLKDSSRIADTIRSQVLAQGKPAAIRQARNLNSILAASLITA